MTRAVLLAVSCSLLGCEPKLVVGERTAPAVTIAGSDGCTEMTAVGGSGGVAGVAGVGGVAGEGGEKSEAGEAGEAGACPDTGVAKPAESDPVDVPWSTGFENDFCDYVYAGGFCFGGGTHRIVTSPVHSGRYAAEFTVQSTDNANNQARCVRQGTLPTEAYYGAWYYVPALATLNNNNSLWNLLHFQGGDTAVDGLWDVTLVNTADGNLQLLVYDFVNSTVRKPTNPPVIPIGSWFHIQFYLKRASDATGTIRLYQDGKLLLEKTNLITDTSSWAQWYVGNIAKDLTPSESTLYVDDVSIGPTGISL
ncbi:MAG TPA: heparin lyase I family protein [Polyangiaceae bacterium]|nr:heparin lyase I family protein [Polyangiaceae bacterium]